MSKDLRIVIVGGGHAGDHTARRPDDRGHDLVTIEKDDDRARSLSDQCVASVIHGDGGRPGVLPEPRLERSDVIAGLTSYGAMTNVGIRVTARRIAPEVKTVARIDHGDHEEFEKIVGTVVYPEELAARTAATDSVDVSGGGVRTIETITDRLELTEIGIAERAPAAGTSSDVVSFPRGSGRRGRTAHGRVSVARRGVRSWRPAHPSRPDGRDRRGRSGPSGSSPPVTRRSIVPSATRGTVSGSSTRDGTALAFRTRSPTSGATQRLCPDGRELRP